MPTTTLRVLVTHRDPLVQRRLQQALGNQPDIMPLEGPAPLARDLVGLVRAVRPDIVVTHSDNQALRSEAVFSALMEQTRPVSVIAIYRGTQPESTTVVPISGFIADDASQAEILRSIRMVEAPSAYLDMLPAIFTRDDFLGRFLRIFETVLDPIDQQITTIAAYFDLDLMPDGFVPWVASWFDLVIDSAWPRQRQIALLRAAPDLLRWRGTRRGLQRLLALVLDAEAQIDELPLGMRLSRSTRLGDGTILGETTQAHHFTVTIAVPEPQTIDYRAVYELIDAHSPAHCTFKLQIIPTNGASPTVTSTATAAASRR